MGELSINSGTNYNESKGRVESWKLSLQPGEIDYLILLRQDEENLTISLRPVQFNGRYVNIKFENALSFRSTQESLFLNAVDPIEKDLWGATFFKVEDSEFVRQFHENSSHAFEDWNITHYAIYTSNFCVDILSIEEPSIYWESI